MRPGVRVTNGVPGIDFKDGLERGVVNAEAHRLIVGLDDMDAAFVVFLQLRWDAAAVERICRVCKLIEPGTDARQGTHETAGAQKPTPRSPASGQETVQLFLVELVFMQKPVC